MKLRPLLTLSALLSLGSLSALASAHVRMTTPVPRTPADNIKTGPCGNQAQGAPQIVYSAGQEIKVDMDETIDHTGCFQITLAETQAGPFVVLNQTVDTDDNIPNQAQGSPRSITGKLPDGLSCESCVLQLRQIMLEGTALNGQCAANQTVDTEPALSNTYFSCADVKITAVGDDAGLSSSSSGSSSGAVSSSSSSGTPSTTSSAGGGNTSGTVGAPSSSATPGSSGRGGFADDEGGCSSAYGPGGGTGTAAVGLLALLGFAAGRRRARRAER